MELNKYQQLAMRTAKYDSNNYPFCALTEENGEVMGKLAKYMRKNGCDLTGAIEAAKDPHNPLHTEVIKELGDVLWNVSECIRMLGVSLDFVAESNIHKLELRSLQGKIVGEGDNR